MSFIVKSKLAWLMLPLLMLTACAPPSPALGWSDAIAPETASWAMSLAPLTVTPSAGTVHAVAQDCPLGTVNEPANPFIRLDIKPDEARASQTLTYCIQLTPDGADVSLPPDVLLHLPVGSKSLRAAGAGWICELLADQRDNLVPDLHSDLLCRNLTVAGARYPTVIQVSVLAPEIIGAMRSCAEARFKNRIETTCASSRLIAGG